MASILIVAHSPLASSLLGVARHVYPDCSRHLAGLDIEPGADGPTVEAQVRDAVQRLQSAEVLILADVFGATPCNAALAVADGVRTRVVAGLNVPMLWRALCYADTVPLDDLVARAVAGATQGVMQVSAPRRQNQANLPTSHDQDAHQHQQ
jgi:PTS system ascorbate-specific IIA component